MHLKFEMPMYDDLPGGIREANRVAGYVFVDEVEIGTLSRLVPMGLYHDLVGRLAMGDLLIKRRDLEAMS